MWSKIDDKLHSSQQARTAGLEGIGLWTLAESYCGDQLTDGFIPSWWVFKEMGKTKGAKLADRLVAAEIWEPAQLGDEKGWNSVGFLPRNKSREWVLADRAKTAKRQAKWREDHKDDEESNAVSNGVRNGCPDQTRPDQTRSRGSFEHTSLVSKPGTSSAREPRVYRADAIEPGELDPETAAMFRATEASKRELSEPTAIGDMLNRAFDRRQA
jgi:hypothetical protein